jgi:predicted ABC-type transport system involved in lysophospholipase L1 biosynthesis ATPase subunit
MASVPLVSLDDVGRSFRTTGGAFAALRHVTAEIRADDRLALMGPSGSGKSTLLHLLAGLDEPTEGSVSWPGLGKHPRALPAGSVAVVFQGPALVPTLDAVENVALPLLLAGVGDGEARERGTAALETLGLGTIATHLPEQLSGGQAQRVAIARAIAGHPSLVLADEPTGQLDRATADAAMDVLLAALPIGCALVVATHDARVAARLAERWQLTDGLLETGAPACSS